MTDRSVDLRLARPMTSRDVALAALVLDALIDARATTSEGELALCIALACAAERSVANGHPEPMPRYLEMVEAARRSGELAFSDERTRLRRIEEHVRTRQAQGEPL